MAAWSILLDLLILLTAATVLGAFCQRLRQSAIVGYLLAGMLIGPNVLHWVSAEAEVALLAELGVAMLLFSIGLEFSWARLRQLGPVALIGGIAQITVTMIIAGAAAMALGADAKAAVALGAMIALSSTAVVLELLAERVELDTVHGRGALGVLLLQDIAMVPLVLLVELLGGEGAAGQVATEALKTVGGAAVLIVTFFVLFNVLVPRLLGTRTMMRNRQLPILLATVTALGSAWAAHAVNISPALGAFVAGMLLAGSPFAVQVRADVVSLRTVLVTLFFGAVGMYARPGWMIAHWWWVLALVAAIIIGKALIVHLLMWRLGRRHGHAFATGLCLAQVGEFSFVLASIAFSSAVIGEPIFLLLVSATIVTLVLTPYLVAAAPQLGARVQRFLARRPSPAPEASKPPEDDEAAPGRVLIVGFGPAGQAVAEMLVERETVVHVIDLNPQIARRAEQYSFTAHVGDASQAEVLEHAGVRTAAAVVIALPAPQIVLAVIGQVRATGSPARIIVRARYHISTGELVRAGADVVVDEEEQVGRRLAAELRRLLSH
ncbi:MAG: cation:proton antiporter [Planctomycetota bacterium]|nr:cation:proton antiporter [Planctomycetota bacterium]